jgi:UrcA family protein
MTHATLKFGFPLAIALVVASGAAFAQQQGRTSHIDVQGGQVQVTPVGISDTGIPVERFRLDRTVSYANLDLSTVSGVTELKKRVRETAREACEDLDTADPIDLLQSDDATCMKVATAAAMRQVKAAIATARSAQRG